MRPGSVWLFPYGRVTFKAPSVWEAKPLKGTAKEFTTLADAHKFIKPILT